MKKILIISADYTGHGHKSVAQALLSSFNKYEDVEARVIDGFSLGGEISLGISKLYATIIRNSEGLWELLWNLSYEKPQLVGKIIEAVIEKNFLSLVKKTKPDVILSVHPNFITPVVELLKKYKLNIPFFTLITELVSVSPLWINPETTHIICPTAEAKEETLKFDINPDQITVLGYPIREKFCQYARLASEVSDRSFSPLRCLIMSGGDGAGGIKKEAKILLKEFNSTVSIITGRNKILANMLRSTIGRQYPERVRIYEFVEDVCELMLQSDVCVARGSPNVMLESSMCGLPLIITNTLPGQEEGNIGFAHKYNIGRHCGSIEDMRNTLAELLENDGEGLNKIHMAQKTFNNPMAADHVTKFILEYGKNECNSN